MTRKKTGLGRGLDALLGTEEPGLRQVSLDSLKPNRQQPRLRFDEAGLEGLAESIRSQGIVQPIVVTPGVAGKYVIVAGERRWRAARLAGLEEVPVVVREVSGDQQFLEMALVENLQRSDLNPVEEADAYLSLQQSFGLSQEEIAKRVGKGRTTIANSLRLLGLPQEILDLLRDGRLRAGLARPLLGVDDRNRQLGLSKKAASGALTARELEAAVRRGGAGRKKKKGTPPKDPDTRAAEDRLMGRLHTRVEIHRRGKGGTVRLHFHSEEELMRLFEAMMSIGGTP